MHGHRFGDRPTALAGVEAFKGLCLLVVGEFGFAAEPRALCQGNLATVVGPLEDPLALVLGHGAEEGDETAA
jgi:hypothetical protein